MNLKPQLFVLHENQKEDWTPFSWKNCVQIQQPQYPLNSCLNEILSSIFFHSKLVFEEEIQSLKMWQAAASDGLAFLLQAGDCAEPFDECTESLVIQKVDFLKEISSLLQKEMGLPVIPIGRMAGQYSKPRSDGFETKDGITLPCYRGDMINGVDFDARVRMHNPSRLLLAFDCAQKTLGWVRQKCGPHLHSFFVSHEALILDYESQFVHRSLLDEKYYHFGAHSVWLGERTKQLDGAHVSFLKGIENPIGVKIGPTTTVQDLLSLLSLLNPFGHKGKINLITRMGVGALKKSLPVLIDAVTQKNEQVSWSVDPMHGNTYKADHHFKTRCVEHIMEEILISKEIHRQKGTVLAGVHLECTPLDVKECHYLDEDAPSKKTKSKYLTYCDPRLNFKQTKDVLLKSLQTKEK